MCFRSLSCSATGKCSSQKIQGTDGESTEVVVPPGLSGRESGSRIQSLLSGRQKERERKKKAGTNFLDLLSLVLEGFLRYLHIYKKKNTYSTRIL